MGIRRTDIVDADFIDATELASKGERVSAFKTAVVVTITALTKTVECAAGSLLKADRTTPVGPGDLVTIAGSTGGNGDYTVDAVTNETTFTVKESVAANGTGGTASFYHPAGIDLVGGHELVRHLSHFLEDGPVENAYSEVVGGTFPTSQTWYTSVAKTHKILEKLYTRNSKNLVTTEVWKIYGPDGQTVLRTITDTITYGTNSAETSRTRTVT